MLEQEKLLRKEKSIVTKQRERRCFEELCQQKKEDIHTQSRKQAESRVKLQLMIESVAEKEEIEVTDQDMSQFIFSQAYQSGQKPDQFVKELKKDQNRLRSAQRSVLFDKTLEFLVDESSVQEAGVETPDSPEDSQ